MNTTVSKKGGDIADSGITTGTIIHTEGSAADTASRTTKGSRTTGVRSRIDVIKPSEDDSVFLEFINANLFGQPKAKEMLLRIHRAAKNPFRDRTRPIYKALMPGDSHTGKTETACVLADYYHGNPEAFIRINCANYKNKGDISRLLGTGPGWIGYQKPPTDEEMAENKDKFDPSALLSAQNLRASRKGSKSPYTIILLDEFEKAGDEFEQFILAIYSAAKERMGNNQEVDFSDCIFLMPCNLGMGEIAQKQKSSIGFMPQKVDTSSELDGIISRRYPIEVINRFDEVCVYGKLTRDDINSVLGLHIKKVQKRVDVAYGSEAFTITVEESARLRLLNLCLNDRGDVSDLKRVVPRRLTDPVSVAVETGMVGAGDELVVYCEGDEICFDRVGNGPVKQLNVKALPVNSEPTEVEREAVKPKRTVNVLAAKLVVEAAGLSNSGDNREAQLVLERALVVLAKDAKEDTVTLINAHNQLGLVFYNSNIYDEAVKCFANAIQARLPLDESNEAVNLSTLYGNLALSLKHANRPYKAKSVLAEGLRAIRLNRNTEKEYGLKHFFDVYLGLEPEKAKELLEFSLSLRNPRS